MPRQPARRAQSRPRRPPGAARDRAGAATSAAAGRAGAASTAAATGAASIASAASTLVGSAAGAAATTLVAAAQEAAYRMGDAATAATFGVLSALRGKRFFHPSGVAFAGRVDVEPGPGYGVPLLDEQRSFEAIARFSRGAGTPEPLPDVLGLAVRILDAHGKGLHQDLLLVTSDRRPLGRHLLLPARGFLSRSYSSVLPYSVGAMGRFCFGADPARSARRPPHPAERTRHADRRRRAGRSAPATDPGRLPGRPLAPWATADLHPTVPSKRVGAAAVQRDGQHRRRYPAEGGCSSCAATPTRPPSRRRRLTAEPPAGGTATCPRATGATAPATAHSTARPPLVTTRPSTPTDGRSPPPAVLRRRPRPPQGSLRSPPARHPAR